MKLKYHTPGKMLRTYYLQEPIAKGGYSTVHKACDQFGTRYIAKLIKKPVNEKEKQRINTELKVGMTLGVYPKIVKTLDAYETETEVVIIQELCRGGNSLEYIKINSSTEKTVASIIRGALRGLAMCHDNGIVHKDIKPLNILMSDTSNDSETKLCDFGLSRYISPIKSMNSLSAMEGTPYFMSPELLRCEYSPEVDVWALGVTTYMLISGRLPFDDFAQPSHPRQSVLFKSIFEEKLNFRGSVWESVSDSCKDFISRCLERDISERPSALTLLDHPWIIDGDCSSRFDGKLLSTKYNFKDAYFKAFSTDLLN